MRRKPSSSRPASPRGGKSKHSPGSRRPPARHSSGGRGEGGGGKTDPALRETFRWVIGIHSVLEALRVRPRAVAHLWIRQDWPGNPALTQLLDLAEAQRVSFSLRTEGQLDQVAFGHQGAAAALRETPEMDWSKFADPAPQIVLILDGLEDPQNLGAILRTAWLTGVSAVFTPADRAVGLTPVVCKVASGGVEHVPVERTASFGPVITELREKGFWIFGLDEKGSRPTWDFQLPEKVVWVVGSEGKGLRVSTERLCDELAVLPQAPTGSSYNASVAAALALYETMRQRKSSISL